MKKIVILMIFFLNCLTLFSRENIRIENIEIAKIKETNPSEHKIICKNGMLFLKSQILINENIKFPAVFFLDTGSANSCILKDIFYDSEDLLCYCVNNTNYLYCDASFEDFYVSGWYLREETNQISLIHELKKIFNDQQYCYGIIGNDILMQKSLLLSISNKFFKWTEKNPFSEYQNVIVPTLDRISSSRGNKDFYQYTIYIEDNYFKSDPDDSPGFGFFNSPDKTKSRYFIDTGTYYISTNLTDLYYQVKNNNYKNFFYINEIGKISGFCELHDSIFLDQNFASLKAIAGRTPDSFKCLGNQILAAFDIYFDKENKEKIQKIYFHPADKNLYTDYRKNNDNSYYYPASTFGFYIQETTGRVSAKAFVDGKELIPSIEIGDTILSINDIPINQVKEWELPDKIIVKIRKKNGKYKVIQAKRYIF